MIEFPDDPIVGEAFTHGTTIYTCVRVAPIVWNASPAAAGIPDAPTNNLTYGRREAAWKALDKTDVGLQNVDNTSDAAKPISTATQTALNAKEGTLAPGSATQYYRGDKTWALLNPAAVGAVSRTGGDTMAGVLTIRAPAGGDKVALRLADDQTGTSQGANLQLDNKTWNGARSIRTNSTGWLTFINNAYNKETHQFADNGDANITGRLTVLADAGGDGINSAGTVTTNGRFYQGAAGGGENFLPGGVTTEAARIRGAQGMGLWWDGGNANYISMGAGISSAWSWQYIRSTGWLGWLNSAGGRLFGVGPGGDVSLVNTINVDQWDGLHLYGNNPGDGTYAYCEIAAANPSWNNTHIRAWHQRGAWAGWQLYADGADNVIQIVMSNGGTWGSIRAAAFEVQSDERIKDDVAILPQQHDAYMAIAPISWEWPVNPDVVDDGIPKDTRDKWGFSAQNMTANVPLAVNGSVTAVDEDGKPVTASVDVIPIAALTVLEVQALWKKVAALEAEILQLKGASA
jgi:hypothetical protein